MQFKKKKEMTGGLVKPEMWVYTVYMTFNYVSNHKKKQKDRSKNKMFLIKMGLEIMNIIIIIIANIV